MEKFNMLLVSVPKASYSQSTEPFSDIQTKCGNAAVVNTFNIPELRVGTLDSLMILDEELSKVDVMAEQTIAKIQRQHDELSSDDDAQGGDGKLLVKGTTPTEYLEQFAWDEARFSHSRRLNELVKMIQTSVAKIDDDMKTLGQDFNETKQHLAGLLRKRGANLMVAELNDVLTPEYCAVNLGSTPEEIFRETTFLQPAAVIVPAAAEEDFVKNYETICDKAVTLKSDGSKFSPVVPGSHFRVMSDSDGYVLYRVFLLKGIMPAESNAESQRGPSGIDEASANNDGADTEAPNGGSKGHHQQPKDYFTMFAEACRASRFLVKKYEAASANDDDDTEAEDTLDAEIARVKTDRDRQMQYLKLRCSPYFEDVYVAWIHIKAIRVFVESVLRYGVPPQFHAALLVPTASKHMRKIRQVLEKTYSALDTMDASKLAVSDDVQRLLGGGGSASEYLPYISISVNFLDA